MPKHLRRSRLGLTQDQGQIWRLCAQSVQMRSDCSIAHVCSMQAYAHTHTHTDPQMNIDGRHMKPLMTEMNVT